MLVISSSHSSTSSSASSSRETTPTPPRSIRSRARATTAHDASPTARHRRLRRRRRPQRTIAIRSINRFFDSSFERPLATARDRRLDATRSIVSISTISHSRDRSRSRSTTPRSSSPAASHPRSNDRGHRAGGGFHMSDHIEGLGFILGWVCSMCVCFEGHDPWVCRGGSGPRRVLDGVRGGWSTTSTRGCRR